MSQLVTSGIGSVGSFSFDSSARYGPVAQPGLSSHAFVSAGATEHLAFNQGVAGSNPVRPVFSFGFFAQRFGGVLVGF